MLEINPVNTIQSNLPDFTHKPYDPPRPRNDKGKLDQTPVKEPRDKVQLSITGEQHDHRKKISIEMMKKITEEINDFITENRRRLSFNIDPNQGVTSVEVINEETGEVVRKIPPYELAGMTYEKGIEKAAEILSL